MKFFLMHRNHNIAELDIDIIGMKIKVINITNMERMPIGTIFGDDRKYIDDNMFEHWFRHRLIPDSRSRIRDIFHTCCIENIFDAISKNNGFSLADSYWIKPENSDTTWEYGNYFDNKFDYSFGNISFDIDEKNVSLFSPDIATDGVLTKAWRINNGERYLLKKGRAPDYQEPINEAFVSSMLKKISKVPYVKYKLVNVNGDICSLCKNFLSREEEFIPAFMVYRAEEKPDNVEPYQHLINMCNKLGIPDITDFMDEMMSIDFLISNSDRHLGNFGFIRNAETLVFTGAAPIFDNGTSLWGTTPTERILYDVEVAKPFKPLQEQQIELVSGYDWLDLTDLADGDMLFETWLRKSNMPQKRIDLLLLKFKERHLLFEKQVAKTLDWTKFFVPEMPITVDPKLRAMKEMKELASEVTKTKKHRSEREEIER